MICQYIFFENLQLFCEDKNKPSKDKVLSDSEGFDIIHTQQDICNLKHIS